MLFTTVHIISVSLKNLQFKPVCKDDILQTIKANVKVATPVVLSTVRADAHLRFSRQTARR